MSFKSNYLPRKQMVINITILIRTNWLSGKVDGCLTWKIIVWRMILIGSKFPKAF
ncbi:hypothetical protein PRO82_000813 [Candidatus Protochlamydia amoebophila]|nr:hypothetical protein [Candidatus Protochlamydia amoebophila]